MTGGRRVVLLGHMKAMHLCPKCESDAVERIRRRGIVVRILTLFSGRRRYRCLDCTHVFYDYPLTTRGSTPGRRSAKRRSARHARGRISGPLDEVRDRARSSG
jgi:hypothetical protein